MCAILSPSQAYLSHNIGKTVSCYHFFPKELFSQVLLNELTVFQELRHPWLKELFSSCLPFFSDSPTIEELSKWADDLIYNLLKRKDYHFSFSKRKRVERFGSGAFTSPEYDRFFNDQKHFSYFVDTFREAYCSYFSQQIIQISTSFFASSLKSNEDII